MKMRRGSALLIIFFFFLSFWRPLKAQVIEQDSLALIDLFTATSGGDWLIPWDTTHQVSEWFGVDLTEDNSRVVGITLPNNQLIGQISLTISNLNKLTSLVLSDNQLEGKIPSDLGTLDTLIVLDLSGNALSDTIPDEIGSLSLLKTLDLSSNELQGGIPTTIGNLDSLRILNLSQNQLSGELPSTLGNLDSLNSFNVSSNNLTGSVPDFLMQLKLLREIDLSLNLLEGILPFQWSEFKELRTLRLNGNKIGGTIPGQIGSLSVLFTLNLSNNLFEGAIPSEIVNLDSLRILDLSQNLLDDIPQNIYALGKLQRINLSQNAFTGNLPSFDQIPIGLEILDLHENEFVGSIPDNYGSILTLKVLDLSKNQLLDSIPESFLNLSDLEILNISNNQLTGLIDISELGLSGNLQQFDVSSNKLGFEDLELNFPLFSDSTDYSPQARINDTLNVAVPTGNMYTLFVEAGGSANKYRWIFESEDSLVQVNYAPENFEYLIENFQESNSGTYSCDIINDMVPGLILKRNPINLFPAINTIDSLALIEFNRATGGENWDNKWNILSEPVFTWQGVEIDAGTVVGLDLENNNLQGFLTDSLGLLGNLKILDLSGNDLEDTLPSGFENLLKLRILDLSNNNFSGRIPFGIINMDSLTRIDLSRNQFESDLLGRFDSLMFLKVLDLSDNDLIGTIPASLSSLPLLEQLALGENRLEGQIPPELGTLENLAILDLSENRLTGEIPSDLALLPNLKELKLFRNQFSGALPESFANSISLERLFINDNRINTLPKFSDDQFNNLELRVFNNVLTFDDFVDNYNGYNNVGNEDEFLFLPQPTIINLGTQTLQKDESVILEIPDNHVDNNYRWLKEGAVVGVESSELIIDSVRISSSGIYQGQVWTTNSNFRDEINSTSDSLVFSFTYTVLVAPPVANVAEPDPFCIGNEKVNLFNNLGEQSGLVSRWYKVHPSLGGIPFSENQNITYSIQNESDTLYVTNGLSFNKSFESSPDTVVIISRPWIKDMGDYLEVLPSDSLLNTRFSNNTFTSSYQWFVNGLIAPGETGSTINKSLEKRYHVRVIRGGCSSTSNEYLPDPNIILGISDPLSSEVRIYPNPVTNILTVEGSENILRITILDLNGTLIKNVSNFTFDKNYSSEINVDKLIPGLYLVRVQTSVNDITLRFVKK